jgi:ABC-type phosphate/phosphonate transport system ATPase subunit
MAEGNDVISAYKKAFPRATKETYIAQKTSSLLNKKEIRTMVKEEREQILKENDVAPGWIVQQYKQIAELSERDSDKLRSLEALAKMSGLFDVDTKKEQLAIFQGFTPEQLESFSGKKTKLIAAGEKKSK